MNVKPIGECRVLVTPATFGRKDPSMRAALEAAVGEVIYSPFGRPLKAEELLPLVAGVDGYIAGVDEVDATVLAAAADLKVIAVYGAGFDRVDVNEATRRGVLVASSRGANSIAVAELTMAFILALARNIPGADASVRRGEWPVLDGVGIKGKTIGIVGLGAIGRAVAHRLKGFECRIIAYDPYLKIDALSDEDILLCSLDELLEQADFVSLHVPLVETTKGMAGRAFFDRMKQGAFLVNTARGDLVDEEALCDALEQGRLRGAALDCLTREPPDKESRLVRLSQVILTPHTGSHTDESLNRMGWTALENCLSALRGERPMHVVNPEVFC
jgi:D-3-phosphoglycerate dehydrogenase